MSAKLRRYTKALYAFDAVVRRVDPERWSSPSPCPEWTAADIVQHQVDVHTMIATMAGGGSPEPGDDPRSTWAAARDNVLEALDTEGALQHEGDTPFGHMTVDRLIGILYVDPLTHTWDLAMATGIDPALDAELCTSGADQLERAGDMIRAPGFYGDAIPYADDADPVTRFLAVAGRDADV
jgi:uncharacterized protein (TIGR03086 family)